MSTSYLNAPHLHDESSALKYVENRVWPNGATCPKCGEQTRVGRLLGKSTRMGVYKCYVCRKPFSVRVGTIFEDSPIELKLWLQAIFLIASSKKGISSNQLSRILGVTLKTAWFMSHRIRLAMDQSIGKLGEGGGVIEADETYIGRKPGVRQGRGDFRHKNAVLALVERDGKVKSVKVTNFSQIKRTFKKYADKSANLMTDEHKKFRKIGQDFSRTK
jgi:transposase-like protein